MANPSNTAARSAAARVLHAYQETKANHAASLFLAWAIGTTLKKALGYWPHFLLSARVRGLGKTTLMKSLVNTAGIDYSAGSPLWIDFFKHAAPVPLAFGEFWYDKKRNDILFSLMDTLYRGGEIGKKNKTYVEQSVALDCSGPITLLEPISVHIQLTGQGTPLPVQLPAWPMAEWLAWQDEEEKSGRLNEVYYRKLKTCRESLAIQSDAPITIAEAFARNYAALLTAHELMNSFASPVTDVELTAIASMQAHLNSAAA